MPVYRIGDKVIKRFEDEVDYEEWESTYNELNDYVKMYGEDIKLVDVELSGDKITMPYIEGTTLQNFIRDTSLDNLFKIKEQVSLLYSAIYAFNRKKYTSKGIYRSFLYADFHTKNFMYDKNMTLYIVDPDSFRISNVPNQHDWYFKFMIDIDEKIYAKCIEKELSK